MAKGRGGALALNLICAIKHLVSQMIDDLIEKGYEKNPGGGNKNVTNRHACFCCLTTLHMQINRVVRQRLLKWVAKAATADTEEETGMLMKRHTVNWYNENTDIKKAHEIQNAHSDNKITMRMRSLVERPKADSHNQTNDRGGSGVAWRVSEMQIEQQKLHLLAGPNDSSNQDDLTRRMEQLQSQKHT